MRIAASNLAWSPDNDSEAAAVLASAGVQGVELAPMKLWPAAPEVAPGDAERYAQWWTARGFEIVGLQGVLFRRPALRLFGEPAEVTALQEHLIAMARLAGRLGARVIVLGAPANRRRGVLPRDAAIALAAEALRPAAEAADSEGCALCIEPNPVRYGCDFITTATEGAQLVDTVNHPGFGLHLDAAAMTLSGDIASVLPKHIARMLRHFHVSEIDLVPVGAGSVDHGKAAALLRGIGYEGWCSLEMRELPNDALSVLQKACRIAGLDYGGASP